MRKFIPVMKNDKLNLWRAVYAERCKYGFRREYGTVEVDDRLCLPHDLDIDVARLRLLKSDHQNRQFRLEDQLLKHFPEQIRQNEGFIAGFKADMETLAAHPHPTISKTAEAPPPADGEQPAAPDAPVPEGKPAAVEVKRGFAGMVVKGETFTEKDKAGAALIEAYKGVVSTEPQEIGSYRGFTMFLSVEDFGRDYILTLRGQMSHRVKLGKDALGNFVRIDNVLSEMPQRLAAVQSQSENIQRQMKEAKAELGKPFPQEAELQAKSARLAELDAALNIDSSHSQGEQAIAKSARPSVLDSLKRPLPPREKAPDKPKRSRQER